MKNIICLGCDHAGFELKEDVKRKLFAAWRIPATKKRPLKEPDAANKIQSSTRLRQLFSIVQLQRHH